MSFSYFFDELSVVDNNFLSVLQTIKPSASSYLFITSSILIDIRRL